MKKYSQDQINEAISVIRKRYPNRLIWMCFPYKNTLLFSLAIDDVFVPDDCALSTIQYDPETKHTELFDYWGTVWRDMKTKSTELVDGMKEKMLIDITEDQLNERS